MPKRATAQESALKSLRKMLASGKLSPGQQIIQDALASRLSVSRVPVREALKVLQAEGRVVHDPHRGYFVAELNQADLEEIYQLRALLEGQALAIGVPKVTAKDLKVIKQYLDEGNAATYKGDIISMSSANRKFHLAIFQLCKQERLIGMIEQLWDSLDAYRAVYLGVETNRSTTTSEHTKMFQALKNKDVKTSIKLQQEHREHALAGILKQLSKREN